MFRIDRRMGSGIDGLASGIAQSRRLICGDQPVVLIMGGRSEIGVPLCGRLNAAGIAVVAVSRLQDTSSRFSKHISGSPGLV